MRNRCPNKGSRNADHFPSPVRKFEGRVSWCYIFRYRSAAVAFFHVPNCASRFEMQNLGKIEPVYDLLFKSRSLSA